MPWNKKIKHKNRIYVIDYALRWKKSIWALNRTNENSNLLKVSYEELVCKTEEVTKSICRFIGEEYDDNMLMNRSITDAYNSYDSWTSTFEESVSREINDSSLNKWEKGLTSFEIETIERFAEPEFTKMGYVKSGSNKMKPSNIAKYYSLIFKRIVKSIRYRIHAVK